MPQPNFSLSLRSLFRFVMAKFRDIPAGRKTPAGSAFSSRPWIARGVLCLLILGCAALFPTRQEQSAAKSDSRSTSDTTAKSASVAQPEPAAKHAKAATENGTPGRAKKEITKKAAASTNKEESKDNANGGAAAPSQGASAAQANPAGEGKQEQEGAEFLRARADWFYRQRAYPFERIPPGARQKALQQLDEMIRIQRAQQISQTGATQLLSPPNALAAGIIPFPGDGNWHLVGPQPTNQPFGGNSGSPTSSGRITAIAVDPSDTTGKTVFVGGAAGGIWKTTDGGATWTTNTDSAASLAIGSLAIAPSNHLVLYAGTGEENFNGDAYQGAGVLKSIDGGATWTQTGASTFIGPFSAGIGSARIGAIAVSPTDPNTVLAGAAFGGVGSLEGIYRTTNGGTIWNIVATASGADGTGVVFDPGNSSIVYAALGVPRAGVAANGIYKSTDGGATFPTRLTTGLPASTSIGRIELAIAPSTTGATAVLYAAIGDPATNNLLGFFQSTDAGGTWTQKGATPDFCHSQCFYDMTVRVHPTNSNFVVVGGSAFTNNSSTLFRSTDGGATWTDITGGSTSVRPHVDSHALGFAANGATPRLYTGDDGGMWRTDDATLTLPLWVDLNATLAITQFYPGVSVQISDDNMGYGGTQDNDTEIFSGTLDWTAMGACGDGGFTAVDSNIPSTVYTTCAPGSGPGLVSKSNSNGALVGGNSTFSPADTGISRTDRSQFIPPLVIDDNNPSILYYGTCRVYQTMARGAFWTAISGDLSAGNVATTCPGGGAGNITSFDTAHQSSDIVFVGTTNGKVWRSLNAVNGTPATWTEFDNGQLPTRHVTAVKTKRSDSTGMIAYATFSGFGSCGGCGTPGHVFKTTNGGTNWSDISGNLPDVPVNDIIAYHQGTPTIDILYIATDIGVFTCQDPEAATPCTNWLVEGTGLPRVPVLSLAMRRTSRNLRAGTHGRSMWNLQLNDIPLSSVTLPAISGITPATANVGDPTTMVTVFGFAFTSNTKVRWQGSLTGVTTTFTDANHLSVQLDTTLFATGGVFFVDVIDPGGVDNGGAFFPFTVLNPVPVLSSINATSGTVGTPVFLSIGGTGFINGTAVIFNGIPNFNSTASGGGTTLTITIPGSELAAPGVVPLSLSNPLPGGGSSGAIGFTIFAAASGALTMSPPFAAFGGQSISVASSVTNVTITNSGVASVTLNAATTITGTNAGDFTRVAPTSGTACVFGGATPTLLAPPPAAGCTFGLQFTASATGNRAATLNIPNTGSPNPQTLALMGFGNSSLVVFTPGDIGFPSTAVGVTSTVINETITNGGTATLNVTSLAKGGANPGDYNLVAPTSNNTPCNLAGAFAVNVGKSCDFGISFKPLAGGGRPATVVGTDDSGGTAGVQQTINLNGTGTGGGTTNNFTNGGADNQWTTPGNWSLGHVPLSTETVTDTTGLNITLASGAQTVTAMTFNNGGTVTISGGSLTFTGSSSATNIALSGGTLTANANLTVSGTLNLSSGQLTGSGTATVTGLFTWSGGIFGGSGLSPVLNANGGITMSGTTAKQLSSGTINLGAGQTAIMNGSGAGGIVTTGVAIINVPATSTWDIQTDVNISLNSGGAITINNAGTFKKSAGVASSVLENFNNTGTLAALSGNFTVSNITQTGGSALTTLNGGNLLTNGSTFNLQGGVLNGTGTLTGTVNNSGGQVNPGLSPGTLTVTGAYTQGAGGILNIELGGTTAGSFDVFAVSGAANLGGTLNALSFGGFTPAAGNSFQVMTYASHTGDFATKNVTVSGVVLIETTNTANVTLTAPGGTPTATANPTNVNFGPLQVGLTSTVTNVQIMNTSVGATLTITSFVNSGGQSTDFNIVAPTGGASPACNLAGSTVVTPGNSCFVGVNFKPSNGGARGTTLLFNDNEAAGSGSVPLSGTGTFPASTSTPPNVNFGNLQVGLTSPVTNIQIMNTSGNGDPLTITSFVNSGGSSTDFNILAPTVGSPACNLAAPTTVTAGNSCFVGVNFKPSNTGLRSTTLLYNDNEAAGSGSVPLSGTGTPGPASIAATSGTPQNATINMAFAAPLVATVKDVSNMPVSGVTVTFTAPVGGASGTFAGGANTAMTNASGVATSAVFTANSTAGSYVVAATVAGVATPANFMLTNNPGPPASIVATSGTPQNATINMAFGAPLAATVKDSGGNLLNGVLVMFNAPAGGASGTFAGGANTAMTNASGVATSAVFTANATAGSYMVLATVAGVATPANFSLTNNPGPPASITATSGTPQNTTISTAFAAPLVATVKDAGSNPVSGVMVTFTPPAGGASGTFASGVNTAMTNASGVAMSAVFTANATAGSYMVAATVAGVATPANFALTNNAGAAASITATSGTPQSTPISMPFAAPLVATVKDAGSNPVSGVMVTFNAPGSGASGTFAGGVNTAMTNASGVATSAVFTANATAGGYTVTATVAGVATPANFMLTNTAGSPTKVVATSGSGQSTTVGTAFAAPLVATVTDSGNNPVNGVVVTFAGPTSGASVVFAGGVNTAMTNASGVATSAAIMANVNAGAYTVTATVAGVATPANFMLTNTPGPPAKVNVNAGSGQSTTINTAFGAPLIALVRDARNNPISGVLVTFTPPGSGASGTFAGGVNTATTDALGNATSATFTANSIAGGPYNVVASVATLGATMANFALTNNAGPAASIAATAGTPQGTAINTAFAIPFQATVKDAGGNAVSGVTVTFTAPAGGASGTFAGGANTAMTNASGVATAAVFTANATTGSYMVTATVPGVATPANFALTNNAGAAASISATSGTPQNTTIGTPFAAPLVATVKDAGSNPVSGVTVTFTAPAGGASGTFAGGANTAITNASGVATSAVFTANTTAGSYMVTAKVSGVATAANFSLTNTAGSATSIIISAGGTQSVPINTAFAALTVTVKDTGGNAVSGVTVTFTAPGSGASGTFAGGVNTALTDVNGVATAPTFAANATTGSYMVNATVPGVAAPAVFNLTNTAGAAASITVTAGTPQNATINTAFATPFQATVKDAGNNPVSGVLVTFTAPAGGASGTFAGGVNTAMTNASGVATAAMFTANSTAGPFNVTAKVVGVVAAANFALTNNPGPPATVMATAGTPQSAAINMAFGMQFQATVKDAGGNLLSGVTVTFGAPGSGASGAFAGGANTAITNASGIATAAVFTANGTAGGPYNVTASVAGVATPADFVLTNLAGAPASVTATAGTPQGATINMAFATQLQVTVKDAGSNPVNGVVVTFTAPSSGASGSFAGGVNTATTGANGVATAAVFTANGTVGTYNVNATVAGVLAPAVFVLTNNAGPAASITATGGTPQNAPINTAFAAKLQVTVKDAGSNPVSGVTVTFTPPANGASGTFAGGANTAMTNASGVAISAVFTANATAGSYMVAATVSGVATAANFALTNTPGPPASISATGGTPQVATVNMPFAAPLQATVKDAGGNVVSGVLVTFTAPLAGASGSFAGGVNTANTNASGVATSAVFTANGTGGVYNVMATVAGVVAPANFALTNNNAQPVATSLSPANILAGHAAFTLTINGNNFVAGAKVDFGADKGLTPTSITATQIMVNIPAADVATAGSPNVIVNNPAPAVGPSVALTFTINNPVPTITSLGQTHAPGGFAFTLTVNGTNFLNGSTIVHFNGKPETTTVVSSTQLTAAILASEVATGGTVPVVVINASPGGGPSPSTLNFTIDDFLFAGPANPVAVPAGMPANFPLTATPGANGFAGQIAFSFAVLPPAMGLPRGTMASLNPPMVTPGATAAMSTFTITTTTRSGTVPVPMHRPGPRVLLLYIFTTLASLALAWAWFLMLKLNHQPGRKRVYAFLPALVLLLGVATFAGCSGPAKGTPAGMTQIKLTATAGTLSHTTTVTLTVN